MIPGSCSCSADVPSDQAPPAGDSAAQTAFIATKILYVTMVCMEMSLKVTKKKDVCQAVCHYMPISNMPPWYCIVNTFIFKQDMCLDLHTCIHELYTSYAVLTSIKL